MTKLFPKCHPYYIIDGKKIENVRRMGPAYTSNGYMLPCCFCDTGRENWKDEFKYYGLWDEHLKVENVENIETILQSDEWYNFHKTLIEEPELAPSICKWKCGIKHTNPKRILEHPDGE